MQDYAIIKGGSFAFKIFRLLVMALLAVHMFACIFWKVKTSSASAEDVELFVSSRNVDLGVRPARPFFLHWIEG